ncbi:alpha/beta fold hydrolase [Streptomyces sp. M19]
MPLLTDPGAHGADPADAFDVVVPDMPGYGYSDRPTGPPPDSIAVADLWAGLMATLGYERFGAAGGDIGSHVSRYLGLNHAERVVGVHRMDGGLPVPTGDPADLTHEERAWFEATAAVTSSAASPRTRSSPTSRSTGSRARSGRRCACTGPTARSRPSSSPAGSRCRPVSRSSAVTSSARPGPGSPARRTPYA